MSSRWIFVLTVTPHPAHPGFPAGPFWGWGESPPKISYSPPPNFYWLYVLPLGALGYSPPPPQSPSTPPPPKGEILQEILAPPGPPGGSLATYRYWYVFHTCNINQESDPLYTPAGNQVNYICSPLSCHNISSGHNASTEFFFDSYINDLMKYFIILETDLA